MKGCHTKPLGRIKGRRMFIAWTSVKRLVPNCPRLKSALLTNIDTNSNPRHSAQIGNTSPLAKALRK